LVKSMIPYGQQWIDENDITAVIETLKSDWITTGPLIGEFEARLCDYVGCRHAAVVNSGTSALDIAVQSLRFPAGSEVITTPLTFVATSNALLYNGLVPVFCDISRDTRNIDASLIRKKITKKTRAVLFVDFAGHPCEIDELAEIAEEHDLYLIEDACHSLGAEYRHRKVGNIADLTIFSFHPVKHITTGEGGAVVLNNKDLFDSISRLRTHGIDRDALSRFGPDASWAYDMKDLGRNYRMTDFQAALGISQLKKLDMFIEKRKSLADRYTAALRDLPRITLPRTSAHVKHAWHIFTILLDKQISRDAFFKYMRSANIGVNVHYIPVYKHSYYQKNHPERAEDYPVTEDIFSRIVTIPLHPRITDEEFDHIVGTIAGYRK
jgi:UDP-4-amino-4,6-dideoxy-N-acetyl-beta-L-altrosamine transaminase